MNRQTRHVALAVGGGLLLLPIAPALANTTIPVLFGAMPGDDFVAWTVLATMLVAVIERPFVTKAGVAKRALLHSTVANLLSMLLAPLGIVATAVLPDYGRWSYGDVAFGVTTLGGLAISIASEFAYYRLITRRGPTKARLAWVALGNAISLAVIVAGYLWLFSL